MGTSEDTTMSSPTTTAKNTATTAVIDAVSKQNFTPGENSGKIDLSGEIVSAFTQSAIIALVPQEYQDLTASITNLGFSLANAYLLPSLSTAMGITINPMSAIDMNALALAQIKNKLENMDKKLDTILTSEMKLAIIKCDKGLFQLNKLDKKNYGPDVNKRAAKEAIEEFRKMYDNSEMAYVKVSTFKEKVFCKSLSIFAYIMKTLYQEEHKTFLTLQTANEDIKKDIADWVFFEVGKVIDEFNAIKIPRLTWDKKGKKEENQNTLDSLLKPCLPLMWNYIDVFKGDLKNEELLKFIPDGQEDAAKIVLENGKTLDVWKTDDQIYSGQVCISCAKGGCRTIEVISDLKLSDWQLIWTLKEDDDVYIHLVVGRYEKVTSLYNGRCQWVRLDKIRGTKISYDNDKNVWGIGYDLRTVQDVPCPSVANEFEYYYGRGQWKPAPIDSIIIKRGE